MFRLLINTDASAGKTEGQLKLDFVSLKRKIKKEKKTALDEALCNTEKWGCETERSSSKSVESAVVINIGLNLSTSIKVPAFS